MDENAVRLERIFEGIFWTDPGPVTRKTRENTASWDSLAHLNLVLSIEQEFGIALADDEVIDRKSTRLNSSHGYISYAVFCLKKKKKKNIRRKPIRENSERSRGT